MQILSHAIRQWLILLFKGSKYLSSPSLQNGIFTAIARSFVNWALERKHIFWDHVDLFAKYDKYLLWCFRLPRAVLMELRNRPAASTTEPDQMLQSCTTTHSGTLHLGLFSHMDFSEWAEESREDFIPVLVYPVYPQHNRLQHMHTFLYVNHKQSNSINV